MQCWFDVGIVVLPAVCVLLRSWCNIGFAYFVCLELLVLAWWLLWGGMVCLRWLGF